jgi:cytochrome c553
MRTLILATSLASLALCASAYAGGNAANGKEIAEKGVKGGIACASCHGADGAKPVAPENPILAGQYYDYLVKALSDYKSGKRANPVMKSMADALKHKDIEDVAAWFASQKSDLHVQR